MDRDRDRGQLLLVAGLGLALAFVVLALVLNAVVFTENLATRNHGETDDVVGHERAVEAGVGGLLVEANTYDDANATTVRAALAGGVERWDANASLLTASSGTVTSVAVRRVENGTRVAQPTERAFSNAAGADDWTAATGVAGTRRFEAVVSPTGGDPVAFAFADGAASWRVEVADEGSATNVSAFRNGSLVATHTRSAETVALDVTEGTVNGTRVAGWTFAENVSAPYEVRVENGGNATGRYGFVVDVPDAEDGVPAGTYASRGGGSPTAVPAVYAATVGVTVRDHRVTYATNVTVAPEASPSPAPWTSPTA